MHVSFHGIYGIDNIKTIDKYRLELQGIQMDDGQFISTNNRQNYKKFKDILNEINNNYDDGIIIHHESYREPFFHHPTRKDVEWFVDHKCCWKDQQFRLDRYYQLILDAPFGPSYMIIAVLKQVIYTKESYPIRQLKWDNHDDLIIQTSIPTGDDMPIPPPSFRTVTERDQEFKDAYIVVRKNER